MPSGFRVDSDSFLREYEEAKELAQEILQLIQVACTHYIHTHYTPDVNVDDPPLRPTARPFTCPPMHMLHTYTHMHACTRARTQPPPPPPHTLQMVIPPTPTLLPRRSVT